MRKNYSNTISRCIRTEIASVMVPKGMGTLRLLVASSLFILASCSSDRSSLNTNSSDQWDFLADNLVITQHQECDQIVLRSSLESSERRSFDQRSANGIVVDPIKIQCLRQLTSVDEIERQANLGDVVARLLRIDVRYGTKAKFCSNVDEVVATLEGIYDVSTISNGREVHRVPEAYYLIGAALFECGRPGWQEFYSLSPSRGFDPAVRHSPVVD